jgi:hypothetical protein
MASMPGIDRGDGPASAAEDGEKRPPGEKRLANEPRRAHCRGVAGPLFTADARAGVAILAEKARRRLHSFFFFSAVTTRCRARIYAAAAEQLEIVLKAIPHAFTTTVQDIPAKDEPASPLMDPSTAGRSMLTKGKAYNNSSHPNRGTYFGKRPRITRNKPLFKFSVTNRRTIMVSVPVLPPEFEWRKPAGLMCEKRSRV